MANNLFNPAREGFLSGQIDWDTGAMKVALVRGYTPNLAHKFVSEVVAAGGTIHATSSALASKTITDGVADAADVTFTAPAANAAAHGLLVFQSSAVGGGADVAQSAQRVIAWIDTGTNFPVVPNGSDIVVQWDGGANRIFRL